MTVTRRWIDCTLHSQFNIPQLELVQQCFCFEDGSNFYYFLRIGGWLTKPASSNVKKEAGPPSSPPIAPTVTPATELPFSLLKHFHKLEVSSFRVIVHISVK